MKRISFFFTLLMLMLGMGGNVNAQTWEFTTVSDADQANLAADQTGNWLHDTANSNDRWCYVKALNGEAVIANGSELEYAKGLKFTFSASESGNLRVDIKNKRMWMATGKILIPGLKAGQQVTAIYMSSSSSTARGINVTNLTPVSGDFNTTGTARATSVGTVIEDGDVLFETTGALYFYSIVVEDVDDDDEGNTGGDETPIPTTDDHSTFANSACNQVVLQLDDSKRFYNTADVTSIDINDAVVAVNQNGVIDTYEGTVKDLIFKKATEGNNGSVDNKEGLVRISEARGWFESAYVKFDLFEGAKTYNVYIKGGNYADYTKIDEQLVRNYGTYGRADVLGLVNASDYAIKVVPVGEDKAEMTNAANEAVGISVVNYDRSGFAHKGRTEGIGAYNNDGSLKAGANVVYITKNNAKSVTLDIASNNKGGTTTYTGFQQLIYGYQKGDANGSYEKKPLCIRIIGSTVDLITELLSGKASSVDDDFHAINVICPVLEELQIFNTIA